MNAQHTPGPWEHDTDNGTFMVCEGLDTVICRGIKSEIDTTVGEGSQVTDVSPEAIDLLRAAIAKATGNEA